MSDPFGEKPFPKGMLIAAGALVAFTLVAVGIVRFTGVGVREAPPSVRVASVELVFEDRADGSIGVLSPDGETVAVLPSGTNGFVRGVMRGMARERRQHGIGQTPPFRLTSWRNGNLSLEDPRTGRLIHLTAFGPSNFGVFAKLLSAAREDRRQQASVR